MKWYDYIVKYFLGILFIFSGLVKINDPIGTGIKLKEYFEVFASDFSRLFEVFVPFNLVIAVFVIVLEIMLGIALLLNYRIRLISWLYLLLIVFFTFLTFYSAAFNKVTDCGCFGEAISLTPWQSFSKDIILLILVIILFVRQKQYQPLHIRKGYVDAIMVLFLVLNLSLAFFTINHLPIIDFRPYKTGNNIPRLMKPSEPYRYKFIMEKDGKEYRFDEYPSDTTYVYKEMIIMNPGAKPAITDYHVWNSDGDYTDSTFRGKKLFIIMYDVKKASTRNIEKIKKLCDKIAPDVQTWILTSSNEEEVESFRHENQLAVPYYYSDMTVLEAVVRSNPGLWLLKDGIVKGVWHHNDVPEAAEVIDLVK
jgi:uncharacterized membrane protein YphA (DoxX/SURF4 family)